jgi:hypothetical protein
VGRFVVERHQAWSRSMTSIIRQRRGCLAEECEGFDDCSGRQSGTSRAAERQHDALYLRRVHVLDSRWYGMEEHIAG